eukprot:TRINITY_DN7576_c0_g1_i8.p1 TRINITY_DN7576_c0_g1~~TRINITY_DN7576_c0_g1_i8.p1  ORF type:complete len:118 (+),score=37.76 TRINITY_DN7576_c0_g1_i8:70-423(+)
MLVNRDNKCKSYSNSPRSEKLKELVQGLDSEDTFEEAVEKIEEYKKTNPSCDLTKYLQGHPKACTDQVMALMKENAAFHRKTLRRLRLDGIGESNKEKCSMTIKQRRSQKKLTTVME